MPGGAPMVQHGATDVSWTKDDLYMRLKDLKRQMEFSDIQEEYIKDDPWLGKDLSWNAGMCIYNLFLVIIWTHHITI